MSISQQVRVVATGVVIDEPHDPVEAYAEALGFLTPEARREIDAWRAGELLLLTGAAFAELDDGAGVRRWGGPVRGPHPVSTHASATDALLELADGLADDLLPALGINGVRISRFDYHAAPRRIEIDPTIRARLRLD